MNIVDENDYRRLIADKDFTFNTADEICQELLKAVQSANTSRMVLDVTQITTIDSLGIKLIVGLYKSCQEKKITLELEVASASLIKILNLCKLNQFIDIKEVPCRV